MAKGIYRGISKAKCNKTNCITICIIIIMSIISVIFIYMGINFEQNIIPIYQYTVERNCEYKVLLKQNDFYETKILPSGGFYTSNAIDEFIINLKYNFIGDRKANIEYNYNITANLVGNVEGSDGRTKEVWNRKFDIIKNKNSRQENISEFNINKQINIDYEYYNNFARSYENEYNIIIDSVLKLRLNISYNINSSKIDDYIEVDIPITNTVTEVNKNFEDTSHEEIIPKEENGKIIFYIIGLICGIVAIAIIVYRIYNNIKNVTPEKVYNRNINHILKYYRNLIVKVTNEPDLKNLKIMNIDIIDDLIDLAEQNQTNIIYYEVIKNEKSKLYVIIGNYVYIYEVTANKLK